MANPENPSTMIPAEPTPGAEAAHVIPPSNDVAGLARTEPSDGAAPPPAQAMVTTSSAPAPPSPAIDLDQFMAPSPGVGWRLVDMMYLVAGVAVITWLGMILGPNGLLFLIVVVGLAAGIATAVIFARLRKARQDALLTIMAIAAERGMPLAPAVAAFADQYRGRAYAQTMNLASKLNQGSNPPQAFRAARTVIPRDSIVLAYIGDLTGDLSKALNLAVSTRAARAPIQAAIATRATYILVLLTTLLTITGFISYFVMPKFQAIFGDFGVKLPEITKLMNQGTYLIADPFTVVGGVLLFRLLIPFGLLCALLNAIGIEIPFFDRLFSRRHPILVLRSLALVVQAGKPIEQGLATLATHYPVGWVRRKLRAIDSDVRQGAGWITALWHHGLMRDTEAAVLASAQKVGNLRWAMSELADTIERRRNLRFQMALQTLFPLVILFIGLTVALVALAYFLPLVALIRHLSESS